MTGDNSLPRKTRSAVAWLRCVALTGDIETVAAASDGASFIPSPTIITLRPCRFNSSIRPILSAGVTPARHTATPSACAACCTAGSRSPDSSSTAMPRAFSAAIAAAASGRSCWRTAKTWHCEPRRNATTDTSGSRLRMSLASPSASQKDGLPSRTAAPSTTARTPLPGSSTAPGSGDLAPAARATAAATG
ncbi:hypothetical protein ES703_48309 [subsurface metagenome]